MNKCCLISIYKKIMQIKDKIKILELRTKKVLNSGFFWNYKSKLTWAWMEFAEHRNYNFWDNIKDIDWKASAKTSIMQLKKYEQEKDLNVFFILDDSFSMQFWSIKKTKKDLLEEIFFTLAMSAYYSNDNIWAVIFDEKKTEFIDYKKSKNNIYKIFEKLETFENSNLANIWKNKYWTNFDYILKNIIDKKTKDNLIFILTDKTKNFNIKNLKIISEQNDLIFINIFDYLENNLLNLNSNISLNLGGDFINIDLNDKEKIKKFQKDREIELKQLKYDLEKNNIWYLRFDTNQYTYKELFKFFSRI